MDSRSSRSAKKSNALRTIALWVSSTVIILGTLDTLTSLFGPSRDSRPTIKACSSSPHGVVTILQGERSERVELVPLGDTCEERSLKAKSGQQFEWRLPRKARAS